MDPSDPSFTLEEPVYSLRGVYVSVLFGDLESVSSGLRKADKIKRYVEHEGGIYQRETTPIPSTSATNPTKLLIILSRLHPTNQHLILEAHSKGWHPITIQGWEQHSTLCLQQARVLRELGRERPVSGLPIPLMEWVGVQRDQAKMYLERGRESLLLGGGSGSGMFKKDGWVEMNGDGGSKDLGKVIGKRKCEAQGIGGTVEMSRAAGLRTNSGPSVLKRSHSSDLSNDIPGLMTEHSRKSNSNSNSPWVRSISTSSNNSPASLTRPRSSHLMIPTVRSSPTVSPSITFPLHHRSHSSSVSVPLQSHLASNTSQYAHSISPPSSLSSLSSSTPNSTTSTTLPVEVVDPLLVNADVDSFHWVNPQYITSTTSTSQSDLSTSHVTSTNLVGVNGAYHMSLNPLELSTVPTATKTHMIPQPHSHQKNIIPYIYPIPDPSVIKNPYPITNYYTIPIPTFGTTQPHNPLTANPNPIPTNTTTLIYPPKSQDLFPFFPSVPPPSSQIEEISITPGLGGNVIHPPKAEQIVFGDHNTLLTGFSDNGKSGRYDVPLDCCLKNFAPVSGTGQYFDTGRIGPTGALSTGPTVPDHGVIYPVGSCDSDSTVWVGAEPRDGAGKVALGVGTGKYNPQGELINWFA